MNNNNRKLLMIIKTSGIKYDDRVRKECLMLEKYVKLKVVAVEDINKNRKGRIGKYTNYFTYSLITRKLFPHKKYIFIKLIEMYIRFIFETIKYKPNIIWIHDQENIAIFPLLFLIIVIRNNLRIVWDQHELLDQRFYKNGLLKKYIKWVFNICDFIIMANHERIDYTLEQLSINKTKKYIVIENYADKKFIYYNKGLLSAEEILWLNGEDYLLAQGGGHISRFILQQIEALLKQERIKLIIIGGKEKNLSKTLEKRWGKAIYNRIKFTGMIDQNDIIPYIDNALASLIFYSEDTTNSKYCAPNRLYQAISRGVPVITGINVPLKQEIKKHTLGITIASDGRNAEEIKSAIEKISEKKEDFKKFLLAFRYKIYFESQEEIIKEITK